MFVAQIINYIEFSFKQEHVFNTGF